MSRYLLIALGAALGANARYLVSLWAGARLGADFPYGTLLVNVSGSLALGFLLSLSVDRLQLSGDSRLLLATGFLGAYTTFSTYAVESLNMMRDAGLWRALWNVTLNNGLGLAAALAGFALARLIQGGGN